MNVYGYTLPTIRGEKMISREVNWSCPLFLSLIHIYSF